MAGNRRFPLASNSFLSTEHSRGPELKGGQRETPIPEAPGLGAAIVRERSSDAAAVERRAARWGRGPLDGHRRVYSLARLGRSSPSSRGRAVRPSPAPAALLCRADREHP